MPATTSATASPPRPAESVTSSVSGEGRPTTHPIVSVGQASTSPESREWTRKITKATDGGGGDGDGDMKRDKEKASSSPPATQSSLGDDSGVVQEVRASVGPTSVCPASVCTASLCLASVCPASVCPASVGPASVGPASVGPVSVGPVSVGPVSVGPVSVGPASVGPASVGPASVGPASVDPAAGDSVSGGPVSGGPVPGGQASLLPVPPQKQTLSPCKIEQQNVTSTEQQTRKKRLPPLLKAKTIREGGPTQAWPSQPEEVKDLEAMLVRCRDVDEVARFKDEMNEKLIQHGFLVVAGGGGVVGSGSGGGGGGGGRHKGLQEGANARMTGLYHTGDVSA